MGDGVRAEEMLNKVSQVESISVKEIARKSFLQMNWSVLKII